MKKYFLVAKNTWAETVIYRLNFVMWRIRTVVWLLTTFFLWDAIYAYNTNVFDYTQSQMLTYVLGTSLISSIVFSTRTGDIGGQIISGDLTNYLLRPVNLFLAWFFREIGDKVINTFFVIPELLLIIFLLHPPLFIQTDFSLLLFTVFSIIIGVVSFFYINLLLGSIGFWSPEVWAPRFIFFIILGFFSGGMFPMDILPKPIFDIFQLLPFPYFMYFPLKIYLGQLSSTAITSGFFTSLVWLGILYLLTKIIWQKGMNTYTAQGR